MKKLQSDYSIGVIKTSSSSDNNFLNIITVRRQLTIKKYYEPPK